MLLTFAVVVTAMAAALNDVYSAWLWTLIALQNIIFSCFKGRSRITYPTIPFLQWNDGLTAAQKKYMATSESEYNVKSGRQFWRNKRAWLTSTDVGDKKIPYQDARSVRFHSQIPAMESSRKKRTRVFKGRLCHRMEALSSIFVNGDQCDDQEEEDAYLP